MSVEFKDYYAILGVERSADDKAIKSAYRAAGPQVPPGRREGQRRRG